MLFPKVTDQRAVFVVSVPITTLSVASDFTLLPKTTEFPVVPVPAITLAPIPPTIFPWSFDTTLVSAIALVVAPAKTAAPIITFNALRLSV